MTAATEAQGPATVQGFVRFLETGQAEGVFATELVCDVNFPQQRILGMTEDALVALRRSEHPGSTDVRIERLDPTDRGWVLQLEERWMRDGERWYSRELFRADVSDGRIVELTVYCTGDWDEALQREHAAAATSVGS